MPDTEPEDGGALVDQHAFQAFEEMGFDVLECLSLVAESLSPSAVREFARTHGCDVRVAVSILL